MNRGMNRDLVELEYVREVKFYPYRRARVVTPFISLDLSRPEVQEFEKELARKSKGTPDNHTCYAITNMDGQEMYIMCSDGRMTFGLKLIEEGW